MTMTLKICSTQTEISQVHYKVNDSHCQIFTFDEMLSCSSVPCTVHKLIVIIIIIIVKITMTTKEKVQSICYNL